MKCNNQVTQIHPTKKFCFKFQSWRHTSLCILTVLPEDPAGLGLVEADGLRGDLRRDDVPGHEEVHLVLKLHLRLFRPDPLVHLCE